MTVTITTEQQATDAAAALADFSIRNLRQEDYDFPLTALRDSVTHAIWAQIDDPDEEIARENYEDNRAHYDGITAADLPAGTKVRFKQLWCVPLVPPVYVPAGTTGIVAYSDAEIVSVLTTDPDVTRELAGEWEGEVCVGAENAGYAPSEVFDDSAASRFRLGDWLEVTSAA